MPHIPKLFCLNCGKEMFPDKTGARLDVHASFGSYYKIRTDVYGCPDCRMKVATGHGLQPLAEHFQDEYKSISTDYTVKLAD